MHISKTEIFGPKFRVTVNDKPKPWEWKVEHKPEPKPGPRLWGRDRLTRLEIVAGLRQPPEAWVTPEKVRAVCDRVDTIAGGPVTSPRHLAWDIAVGALVKNFGEVS